MKKRVLFVEDNAVLLGMYRMMMLAVQGDWEVATAADPLEGLKLLETAPFDVVVSDLHMPGMDGIQFLGQVRQEYPGCSRVIVSGLSDQTEAVRCLNSTHQFLAKPFDVKALRGVLSRIGTLDAYLQDEDLKALVGKLGTFPSFPSLYVEVMKEISSEEPSIANIGQIIAKDPGMTAKMLHLVNSAAMGLSRRVTNAFEAVQFLGINTVRSLVLSAHIFSCFEHSAACGLAMSQLWAHAMRTGVLARKIAGSEQLDPTEVEDANIAGVMHDMGKLMLADALPGPFQQALALATENQMSLEHAELELFGASHAGIAAYLLGLWGLPSSIVEAVAFHNSPGRSQAVNFSALTAVHVANVLDHQAEENPTNGGSTKMDNEYLTAIGVLGRVDEWRKMVQTEKPG